MNIPSTIYHRKNMAPVNVNVNVNVNVVLHDSVSMNFTLSQLYASTA